MHKPIAGSQEETTSDARGNPVPRGAFECDAIRGGVGVDSPWPKALLVNAALETVIERGARTEPHSALCWWPEAQNKVLSSHPSVVENFILCFGPPAASVFEIPPVVSLMRV